jgi:DNA-binding PadR family transcriptional regulator
MTQRLHRPSPLAVAVLSLLHEAPMHAYRMQQLIKERHKDEVVNVAQRNSVYQTIDRLGRAGLLQVQQTARDEGRPERTIYEITPSGLDTLRSWLIGMLGAPAREFPEFPAALALFLPTLEPAEVIEALASRQAALEAAVARGEGELRDSTFLPRLFLLETEYTLTVTRAELSYVVALLDDLRSGRLSWSLEALRALAHQFGDAGAEPPGLS